LNLVANINKELSGEVCYNYLYNLYDLEIIFKKNESGYSKDIDGQVRALYFFYLIIILRLKFV